MRKIIELAALPFVCSALWGCVTSGGSASVPAPDPKYVISANKSLMWKDPESVRDVSYAAPRRNMLGLGWEFCMKANAKNSYGGYGGLTTYTVLVYDNGAAPMVGAPTVYDGCERLYYEPFPDIEIAKRTQ